MLATVPTHEYGSRLGLEPEPNRCNGSYHTKTQTVAIGPVIPPTTWHFNITTLAPIKYLSSDRITTWSIRRLCRISRSFTSHVQNGDLTNICLVIIKNPRISPTIVRFLKATQRLLVGSPIWKREVKERLILYNLHINHVTIRSQLIYLTGAKVAGTAIWNRGPGTTRAKNRGFMSDPGNNPAKTQWVEFLPGSGTERNRTASQNPDGWRVTRTRCEHYWWGCTEYLGGLRVASGPTYILRMKFNWRLMRLIAHFFPLPKLLRITGQGSTYWSTASWSFEGSSW